MIDITKYRFKTKEEFKAEYGNNWRLKIVKKFTYVWTDAMDNFFGKPLSNFSIQDLDEKRESFCKINNYRICKYMITPIKTQEKIKTAKCSPQHKQVYLTIDLTGDGTLTVDYSGYEGIAKCHPDDEFDYRKGMAIALHRIALQLGEYEIEKEKTVVVKEKVKTNILDEI